MIVTTPTATTTAEPSAFMSTLGHLKVSAEQEGIKLYHEAGQWLDHLSWNQVEHLLVPAIRAVAPGVLSTVATVAEDVTQAVEGHPGDDQIPADVLAQLDAWLQPQFDKFRAEIGQQLDTLRQQLPAAAATPDVSGLLLPDPSGSDAEATGGVDPVVPAGETDTTGSAAMP